MTEDRSAGTQTAGHTHAHNHGHADDACGCGHDHHHHGHDHGLRIASQPARSLKVGRNDPCPCGSGQKFKKCCIDKVRG